MAGRRRKIAKPVRKGRRKAAAASKRRRTSKASAPRAFSPAVDDNEVVRLKRELAEARERQAATAQVLAVIKSSPGELKPVFNAILKNATRICKAKFGVLMLREGDAYRVVAMHNAPRAYADYRRREPIVRALPGNPAARVGAKEVVQIADVLTDSAWPRDDPQFARFAKLTRARSLIAVPMLDGDELIGLINVFHQEVRSFPENQVELLTNFAAQAVIAIENARLFNELRLRTGDLTESLEQQTATSEVLKVISSSPGELEPVFQAMLENAVRICQAKFGTLYRFDGTEFYHVAGYKTPDALIQAQKQIGRFVPEPGTLMHRVMQTGAVAHSADYAAESSLGLSAKFGGARSTVVVPMLKDRELVGAFAIYRQEVRPFTDKQIELVQNFAAQAVVAIENTRLLNELRQSLEQQTATADVLRVISSSPGELEPVFSALLENATRICDAHFGNMFLYENEAFRAVAMHNAPEAYVKARLGQSILRPRQNSGLGRVAATKKVGHIVDLKAEPAYADGDPFAVSGVELAGIRTLLAVPMLKDDNLVGAIVIYRREVRPFTDKQIALVQNFAAQAVIAIENTRLLNELRQSLEQQTATADVLRVISSSPGELQPVFNAMLENAVRICGAKFGVLFLSEADGFRYAALHDVPPAFAEARQGVVTHVRPGTTIGRVAATMQPAQIADVRAEPAYTSDPERLAVLELAGARTILGVPLIKDDALVGVVTIFRQEVRPFTDKETALVKTFADQAVIAIENTRLLNELRQRTDDLSESLEQQTATSEVLKVISASPGELQPVFQATIDNATRLCGAKFGALSLREGDVFRNMAMHGVRPAYLEERQRDPIIRPTPGHNLERLLRTRAAVHIPDLASDVEAAQALFERVGARALLNVPLLKSGDVVGSIMIYREEPGAFTEKQIELVQNFAAQAVIAIENTRLLNELRQRTTDLTESLEQQTATSEVLKVISSSPGELDPVFNAMLENATRICEAKVGNLFLMDGEDFRAVAVHGESAYADWWRREPLVRMPGHPGTPLWRLIRDKQVIHIPDLRAEQSYLDGNPRMVSLVDTAGARTHLVVPMLKESELIGAIVIYRQEVRPFTDKQIALVQNFAAQAVIAIENTRLLNELRQRTTDLTESLEQQTATSEVLKIISSSPGELDPVFKTILQNATRICGAEFGHLFRYEEGKFRTIAMHNTPPAFERFLQEGPIHPAPSTGLALIASNPRTIHITDVTKLEAYAERDPFAVAGVELGHVRTLLIVPMLKDATLIGVIAIFRQEIRPFTEKQIELVTNFGAQAVIAIENARLLNELRQRTDDLSESLERQTVTAEILSSISGSLSDPKPVFDAILQNLLRLFGTRFALVTLVRGKTLELAGIKGEPGFERMATYYPVPLDKNVLAAKAALSGKTLQVVPVIGNPDAPAITAQWASEFGFNALISVPLMREGSVIGSLSTAHRDPIPFTDKQVALIKSFAAQAVIAIENARLLRELRQRTDDLSESLERQTATSEVLRVISSSPGELEPVFQSMLANATRICEAKFGNLWLREGDQYRIVSTHDLPEYLKTIRTGTVVQAQANPTFPLVRAAKTRRPVHIADLRDDESFLASDPIATTGAEVGGVRTLAIVPLLKDQDMVGAFAIFRQEVRPFTEKQIELVQNFAAQAVIAIENTRLLKELRESLQQQTATADVLQIISRSTFDLQTVLNTLVESAAQLCDADMAVINRLREAAYQVAASHGLSPEQREGIANIPIGTGRGTVTGRAAQERRPVHVIDVKADPEFSMKAWYDQVGSRTMLGVPLLREGAPVGVMVLMRKTVQPFTESQIALLTTFADQAGIAIENVRLFEAEQERTRELAKSLDDLRTAQDRLVQTQKLASLGQLTAGIAHEIKNPLNFVNNFSGVSVELLDELREAMELIHADDATRAEIAEVLNTLRQNLAKVVQHGKRADSIVKNMLLHSREGSGEHRLVDINALVEESLNLAYHGARAERQDFNITLTRTYDPEAGGADLFPQEITRVLLNLISNGFYAATKRKQEAGKIGFEPMLAAATRDLGDSVEISIRDNGTGIPPDVKEKMFNPFFTTKPAGEGTGLGLSISHDIIVKQHAGTIEVDTQPGKFTEIRIVLPRMPAAAAKPG